LIILDKTHRYFTFKLSQFILDPGNLETNDDKSCDRES